MCGIIAAFGKNPQKHIKKLYEQQKSRGRLGFGYIAIKNNKVVSYQRHEEEQPIMSKLNKEGNVDGIIFHHRLPTSTPNFETSAHPIKVSHESLDYDYYVVHNGVITSPEKLKEEHEELGFEYNTYIRTIIQTAGSITSTEKFNDSEALAIELARLIDGKSDTVKAEGSMAFIVVQTHKETNEVQGVFYGRNYRNPLVLNRFGGTKNLTISSQNEKGFDVIANTIYSLNLQTKYFSIFKEIELSPVSSYKNVYGAGSYGSNNSDFYNKHRYDTELKRWVPKDDPQPKLLQDYNPTKKEITVTAEVSKEDEQFYKEIAEEIADLKRQYRTAMKNHEFETAQELQAEIDDLMEWLIVEEVDYDPKLD